MANEVIITRDSRPYKSFITDVGNAKMTQAVLEGRKVNIKYMALGDGGGSYYLPTPASTTLVREVWRGEIASKAISELSPNIIAVRTVLPSDVGGFTIREGALFDTDGDMIAVCNMPETAKATLPDGVSSSIDIVINILLTNVDAVEIIINPTLDPASKEDVAQAIAAHNADPDAHGGRGGGGTSSSVSFDIVVPTAGWVPNTDPEENPAELHVDIPIEDVTADMIPYFSIFQACRDVAKRCGWSNDPQTIDGALRVYAQTVPEAQIAGTLTLLDSSGGIQPGTGIGPGLTFTAGGKIAVKIGDGLAFDADNAVAVDGSSLTEATAEELAAALSETDENAAAMIDEVYG